MEIRTLKYFLAIVKEQSISKAAKSLNMTQPNLSRQIHELESHLQKKLFIRGNRQITLTRDGLLFKKRAEEILKLINKTENEISMQNEINGEITIATCDGPSLSFIMRVVNKIHHDYPLIQFSFINQDDDSLSLLNNGLIDFLISNEIHQQYNYLSLPEYDQFGLLMNKSSRLSNQENIIFSHLTDLPLYVPNDKNILNNFYNWFELDQSNLHIIGKYDMIYNISLLLRENSDIYILTKKNMIPTDFYSPFMFVPLFPRLNQTLQLTWYSHPFQSKIQEIFINYVNRELLKENRK